MKTSGGIARLHPAPVTRETYALWCRAVERQGHGITSRELRELWPALTSAPIPPSYATYNATLIRRGELEVVGDCMGNTVYVPAAVAPALKVRGLHFDDHVIQALRASIEETQGAAVTTGAVLAQMEKLGTSGDETRVLRCLKRFTRVDYRLTPDSQGLRVSGTLYQVGDEAARWAWNLRDPASSGMNDREADDEEARVSTLSLRQAIVSTFARTESLLGSPPSREEWKLYVQASQLEDPVASLIGTQTGYTVIRRALLANRSQAERSRKNYTGLRRVETTWSSSGMADHRFSATPGGEPPDCDVPVVLRALDTLVALRPDLELESIGRLDQWWKDERRRFGPARAVDMTATVGRIVADRTATLTAAMCAALPAADWPDALSQVIHRANMLSERIELAPLPYWKRADLRAEHVALPVTAAERVQQWCSRGGLVSKQTPGADADTHLLAFPQAGTASAGELRALFAARYCGIPQAPAISHVFRYARKGRTHAAGRGSGTGLRGADNRMSRDRVDAWLVLFADANAPRAWALLDEAHGLLGRVVRDVSWLRELQAALSGAASELVAPLQIARALLGDGPTHDEVTRVRSAGDARVIVLATVLAMPAGSTRALRELTAAWALCPLSESVAQRAWVRARSHETLYVIEGR